MKQSEYFGVYHNTQEASKTEVPFRAAVKLRRQGNDEWVNLGYTKHERVAARVYNMYAVKFFGAKAILNNVPNLSLEEQQEFEAFVNAEGKPKRREVRAEATRKAQAIIDGGNRFRKHDDPEFQQKAAEPAQPSLV